MPSWSVRIALFSTAVLATAGFGHRFLGIGTPLAINLVVVSVGLAVLAVLVGIVAMIVIWRRGLAGFGTAGAGMVLGGLQLFWPVVFLPAVLELPRLNDVTTDIANPPGFSALARLRVNGANPAAYPGAAAARLQASAYPDLSSITIDRGADDAFAIVSEVMRRLKWQPVAEAAPSGRQAGFVEAYERTLVLGFYDDVVVRITGEGSGSRIDVRSGSRFGAHDLGRNAQRIRQFYRELKTRLELTDQGIAAGARIPRGALVKRAKAGDRETEDLRKSPAAARSDAQRGQVPKEKPR